MIVVGRDEVQGRAGGWQVGSCAKRTDEGDWSAENSEPRLAESVKKGRLKLTFARASGEAC